MRRILLFALTLAVVAMGAAAIYLNRPTTYPEVDTLDVSEVVQASGTPKGMAFLFSDQGGYGQQERTAARAIAAAGATVVGVDLPRSFVKAAAGQDDCVYFVSDIEQISQTLQRSIGMHAYVHPIVVGTGVGGTMALALAAQSPQATIKRFVAVDPGDALPFAKQLCSGAPHQKTADGKGWVYGLQPGSLPAPMQVIETPAADAAGKAHVASLVAQGFAIDRMSASGEPGKVMVDAVAAILAKPPTAAEDGLSDLPLALLPAQPTRDTMAIVLSGDGGWRDIDRQIAESLAAKGVPTVGIDSLRYFWSEKKPETIAADLDRIIDHYTEAWQVHKVVLIGYSFGADVLPAAYNKMTPEDQSRISLLSLLGLSGSASFEFDVSGWLGVSDETTYPTLPDVGKIAPKLLQCIYGEDDDDAVCAKLEGTGAEVVRTPGGHHFDDDYEAVAQKIMARIA